MSSPIGFDTDTVNFPCGPALVRSGADFDFCTTWVFAFRYEPVNCFDIDIHNRGKFVGQAFRVSHVSGLDKNGLDFVACGKYSSATIEDNTPLRFLYIVCLPLPIAGGEIVASPEVLQIKASAYKRQEGCNQKQQKKDCSSGTFQSLTVIFPGFVFLRRDAVRRRRDLLSFPGEAAFAKAVVLTGLVLC